MRIDFVSAVPVFPSHGGNRTANLSQIMMLRDLGHDVRFILMTSRKMGAFDEQAHRAYFGSGFVKLERGAVAQALYLAARGFRVAKRLVRERLGLPAPYHASVDAIYFKPFDAALKRIFDSSPPDVCWVMYVYFSRAFLNCPPRTLKVLETQDSFGHQLAPQQERRGLLRADVVLAIQEQEADYFRDLLRSESDRVRQLSLIREPEGTIDLERSAGATFFGSSFMANIASLAYLTQRILPLVLEAAPEFRLSVAGSVCRDTPDHPSVAKLGLVDTIADAYRAAPILANAITEGTGLKIKLIEALLLGIPTVSTRFGVLGIPDSFLTGVIVVDDDDPAAFAAALVRLYRNPDLRGTLGRNARRDALQWNAMQRQNLQDVLAVPASSRAGDGAPRL